MRRALVSARKFATVAAEASEADTVKWNNAKPYSAMPGPKPLPLLGNTWRFLPVVGDYTVETIDKISLKLYQQYGTVVKMGGLLGRPDMVFVFDADEIERVFRNEELMPHRPSMPSLNYYKHQLRKDFFGDLAGVIAVHGENWYKFRTKVQQPMLQPRTARTYVPAITETAECFVQRCRKIRDSKLEMPADFLNEVHKWSLQSIARIALDVRLGCLDDEADPESQKLIDALLYFFEKVFVLELKSPYWKIFPTPTFKKYIAALDTLQGICMKHINAALEDLSKKDIKEVTPDSSMLQRILAMENDPKIAAILALDLFLVGIDTTSTAVASTLYQLALHPDKQQKLYEEVHRVLPTRDATLTSQKLEDMPYLRAVIKETLRKYPVVVGNGRTMTRDTVVGGYQIPQGVQIVFQHTVLSNLPKYFPNPDKFLPERWLKGSPEQHPMHPFASLPFGYGRRMCLGRRFAELEIQTITAKMVQAFIIEYHHKPLDYYIHPMYTPNGPLRLRLIDRL